MAGGDHEFLGWRPSCGLSTNCGAGAWKHAMKSMQWTLWDLVRCCGCWTHWTSLDVRSCWTSFDDIGCHSMSLDVAGCYSMSFDAVGCCLTYFDVVGRRWMTSFNVLRRRLTPLEVVGLRSTLWVSDVIRRRWAHWTSLDVVRSCSSFDVIGCHSTSLDVAGCYSMSFDAVG